MRAKLFIASCALAAMVWAAPNVGAAHFLAGRDAGNQTTGTALPLPAQFRAERERGLLLRVWLNGRGPYIFVVDTGAGFNVIAARVVSELRLPANTIQPRIIGGLTTSRTTSNREAVISRLDIGTSGNRLPQQQKALIVSNLPLDVDGILDPTEAYAPYGYSIDLPNERIAVMSGGSINSLSRAGAESAVVSWVRNGADDRPFVRLGDGRIALVDTGSRFGLAVSGRNAVIVGPNNRRNEPPEGARDIGGGTILSRRVAPTTITIGELVLRRIPTDILFGIDNGAPVILGRDALHPFKISFDPQQRLIEFVASSENS
jgi:predicted aspartyl protease